CKAARLLHLFANIYIGPVDVLGCGAFSVGVGGARSHRGIGVGVVGLGAARCGIVAVVGVAGSEQISLGQIGDFGSLFQGKVGVIPAGVNHLRTQTILDQFSQST